MPGNPTNEAATDVGLRTPVGPAPGEIPRAKDSATRSSTTIPKSAAGPPVARANTRRIRGHRDADSRRRRERSSIGRIRRRRTASESRTSGKWTRGRVSRAASDTRDRAPEFGCSSGTSSPSRTHAESRDPKLCFGVGPPACTGLDRAIGPRVPHARPIPRDWLRGRRQILPHQGHV